MVETIDISVVISVKNGEKYLQDTLKSISNQTFTDFEVIVVNDGSTDNTSQIVENFSQIDSRFHLVDNQWDAGKSMARNFGVSLASGVWIAICDADDLWDRQKLARQVDFRDQWRMQQPIVAIGTAGTIINSKNQVISTLDAHPTSYDEYEEMITRQVPMMLNHSSVIFRKETFMQLGGYRREYVSAEDTDLFTRMARCGVVINIPEYLFHYRKHLGSFSLARTAMQTLNLMRIEENVKLKDRGLEEMGYEEFLAYLENNQSKSERRKLRRRLRGKYLYRSGAVRSANKQFVTGAGYLLLASLYDYRAVFAGLRRSKQGNKFYQETAGGY